MAKREDFSDFVTPQVEVKNNFDLKEPQVVVSNSSSKVPLKEVQEEEEEDSSLEEVVTAKDFDSFLNSAKFMKTFENVNLDKSSITTLAIYKSNIDAVNLLLSMLSSKKIGKGELVNMIIANFFKKYSKEIKEAYKLYTLNRTLAMFD